MAVARSLPHRGRPFGAPTEIANIANKKSILVDYAGDAMRSTSAAQFLSFEALMEFDQARRRTKAAAEMSTARQCLRRKTATNAASAIKFKMTQAPMRTGADPGD